jgi:hypothetical protein
MPGDSGSPVFSGSGTPLSDLAPATLYGLVWAGNGTNFGFSTLPQIAGFAGRPPPTFRGKPDRMPRAHGKSRVAGRDRRHPRCRKLR